MSGTSPHGAQAIAFSIARSTYIIAVKRDFCQYLTTGQYPKHRRSFAPREVINPGGMTQIEMDGKSKFISDAVNEFGAGSIQCSFN